MDMYFNNLRHGPAIEDQPAAEMENWRILEFSEHKFLAGWLPSSPTIRRTSPIQTMDLAERKITTLSGRVYQLNGPPAEDMEKIALIYARLSFEGISAASLNDVSGHVWESVLQAGS